MICHACGNNTWRFERKYNTPDKYEQWCGVPDPIQRTWYQCDECGLYKVLHSYSPDLLESIYTNGYRAKNFRGGDILSEFMRINELPYRESENLRRVNWLKQFVEWGTGNLLDVGSGLGVFPNEVAKTCKCKVKTIEPNKDSYDFIESYLGYDCRHSFYKPGLYNHKFDWITCVHVLEHQKKPEEMLLGFREDLKENGHLFIEVPDACEFEQLEDDNDEFNSTHLYFFSPVSLIRIVEGCGFKVTDMHRVKTEPRGLYRIMMVAEV